MLGRKHSLLLHAMVPNTMEVIFSLKLPGSSVTGSKQEPFCHPGILGLLVLILIRPSTTINFSTYNRECLTR